MIKIALLGAGAISDSHITAYMKFPERCQISALVDLYPEKAEQKKAQYGLAAQVYPDLTALLNDGAFDAASILLPPFAHASAAIDLLKAGKHVLVEKPMAPSLEECDAMLSAARSSGRLLGVVAQNRFKTPMMKLKQVLDSGIAGRMLHAQVDSFWWRGSNYYDLWWRGTWEKEGGGCTMNHAVHHIDLFQWMAGKALDVQSLVANLNHQNSEVEDLSMALIRFESGAAGILTASLVHHGEDQQLAFQCEHALVAAPWRLRAMRQKENGFPEDDPRLEAEIQAFYDSLPDLAYSAHDGQILNFLKAITGEETLLVDGVEGRRTLELVAAIYQSGFTRQPVELPLQSASPFYSRSRVQANARHFHEKARSVENFNDNSISLGSSYTPKS